jgi:hypothetical protein
MVIFADNISVGRAIELGKEAEAYCSPFYGAPHKLSFECVYKPMLLK